MTRLSTDALVSAPTNPLYSGWGEESEQGTLTDTATEPEATEPPPNAPVQAEPWHDELTLEQRGAAKEAAEVTPSCRPRLATGRCDRP